MVRKGKYDNFLLKFIRQSSHYFSGYALGMVCGLISFPILTRIFSKSGYGIISLISTTLWIFLAITKLGMQESSVRFYNEFKMGIRKDKLSVFYSTLYFGSLGFTLIVVSLAYFISLFLLRDVISSEMQNLLWIVALMVISGSMFLRLTNFLRAEQRTKLLNSLVVIARYTSLGLAIIFILLFGKTLKSYYSGVIITEFLMVIILSIFYVRHQKLKFNSFSFPFLKESILFGIPFIGLELADYLIKSTDRYLIQIYLGLESVGLYAAASNLCIYIKDGILFPLIYAITPIYMELWESQGEKATGEFLSRIFNYLLVIVIPIIFGFSFLGKQVILLMASKEFEESAQVIPYIIPGALLWGLSPIFSAGLYIRKQTKKLTLIVFIGVCINTILNILLIPTMHLRGSALATLVTYFILLYLLKKVSSKNLRPVINISKITKYSIAALIMTLCLYSFDFPVSIPYLFINILIGAGIYTGIVLIIDKDIRDIVTNFVARPYLDKAN